MNTVVCPQCGTMNQVDTTNCGHCGINLQQALRGPADGSLQGQTTENSLDLQPGSAVPQATLNRRPGCVTLIAILIGIGASLSALGGIVSGASMIEVGDDEGGLITILVTCGMAGLYFLIATGLWRVRNWARVAFLVVQGLGLLIGVFLLLSGITSVVGVVGLVVGGYTLYWFAVHREYFLPASPSETAA